jgi:hypothetical protein
VLLQDSVIGLEKFLMTLFAKAIAWFEEYAFLQGNRKANSANVYDVLRLCAVWACTGNQNLLWLVIVCLCLACWLPIGSQRTAVGDNAKR